MPYHVRYGPGVRGRIARWGLPDPVLVEVHLRLGDDHLGANPSSLLEATANPREPMVYRFSMVDPDNRFSEHLFRFHVRYGQDEETLWVVRGRHLRHDVI